jgi:hypothetical protein
MCRNYSNHPRHKRTGKSLSPKHRFYRQLRSFLVFNLVMMVLNFIGSDFGGLWKVSAIWSIFLAVKYVKLFGIPGTNGWFSEDWEAWMAEREAQQVSNKPSRPDWKEKDLV